MLFFILKGELFKGKGSCKNSFGWFPVGGELKLYLFKKQQLITGTDFFYPME